MLNIFKKRKVKKMHITVDQANMTIVDGKLIIDITSSMLENNEEQVIENIKGLISFFNKEVNEIQFGFTIQEKVWQQYQELFASLKGNMLELRIEKEDIQQFIMMNTNLKIFMPHISQIRMQRQMNLNEQTIRIDDVVLDSYEQREILDIILGIRKDVAMYSKSVVEYLYEFLQNNPQLKYSDLLGCLQRAAEKELENPDDAYQDRLISFSKLQCELESEGVSGKYSM